MTKYRNDNNLRKLTQTFQALSDPTRIRILKLLEHNPLCVCELTEILSMAPSTVSKHLSILFRAHLVTFGKSGKWVIYSLNRDSEEPYVQPLLLLLNEWLPAETTLSRDRNVLSGMKPRNLADE